MPCSYNSPNANATTILVNVPFNKADLGSHILWMCTLQWQDQYNLHEKGMTPLDMCTYISWGYWASIYPGEGQCTIQENFWQGQEKQQATWYQIYCQSPREILHQEALQPMQEAWGHAHDAQYKRFL